MYLLVAAVVVHWGHVPLQLQGWQAQRNSSLDGEDELRPRSSRLSDWLSQLRDFCDWSSQLGDFSDWSSPSSLSMSSYIICWLLLRVFSRKFDFLIKICHSLQSQLAESCSWVSVLCVGSITPFHVPYILTLSGHRSHITYSFLLQTLLLLAVIYTCIEHYSLNGILYGAAAVFEMLID